MSAESEIRTLLNMNGDPDAYAAAYCLSAKQIYAYPHARSHPQYKATVAKLRLLGIEVIEIHNRY